jgi:prefoldin subunit 5
VIRELKKEVKELNEYKEELENNINEKEAKY